MLRIAHGAPTTEKSNGGGMDGYYSLQGQMKTIGCGVDATSLLMDAEELH